MIANDYGAWLTVKEAAIIAKRSPKRVYDWIKAKKVRTKKGINGVTEVWGADVLKAEKEARNGRPPK